MGKLDQFIKQVFSNETESATQDGLAFSVPPETPTTEVLADGLLRLKKPSRLLSLSYPWRLAHAPELVLEFKMQRDHIDRYEAERGLLRRQAQQCLRAKTFPKDKTQLPLWIVAAYLPAWLKEERLLESPALGCYRIEPAFYEVYWIASNELPLQVDLIPFLVTRTGRALVLFAKWLLDHNPKLCEELLEVVPMTETQFEEVMHELKEPSEQERLRRRRQMAEALAEGTGLKDELLTQGEREGELHAVFQLASLRVGRELTEAEQSSLAMKVETEGLRAVQKLLLELDTASLADWLKTPDSQK